jgi:hypothetical protein
LNTYRPNYFDYSPYFNNNIKLFLTQSDAYWDSGYPNSRKNKIIETFSLSDRVILAPKQVHGDAVVRVTEDHPNPECDGIIYNQDSSLVGTINVADCVPICVYDSYGHNIGLIHSGWRGTHEKIILNAIDSFESMGSPRNCLRFFLGPSIRSCCYEVDKGFSKKFRTDAVFKRNGKYFIDLSTQVKLDLEEAGISIKNIMVDDLCTYDSSKCHSFRRDYKGAGRMTMIAYRG